MLGLSLKFTSDKAKDAWRIVTSIALLTGGVVGTLFILGEYGAVCDLLFGADSAPIWPIYVGLVTLFGSWVGMAMLCRKSK
jgi:predicted lysophospholipase L1 biosynthesis ABC-type transport system permease subunit